MFEMGHVLAILGAGLAVILPGIGSAYAVAKAGQTTAGLTSEKPKLFIRAFFLHIFPATNGIYGFVAGFLILQNIWSGGALVEMTLTHGLGLLLAALPIAIVGCLGAFAQGRVSRASIQMLGKQPDSFGKGLMLTGIVEMYCILALVITIFLIG
ncbi:MAG: V-type ATP synthase subunit K [Firmicutes bacterium]|nr:V-type ATP synthase subunit K [Bacillota bacterium]